MSRHGLPEAVKACDRARHDLLRAAHREAVAVPGTGEAMTARDERISALHVYAHAARRLARVQRATLAN